MRTIRNICILLAALLFTFSSLARAEVEQEALKTLKLEAKPIDVTVSADGNYTFILVEGGKVLIYDTAGKLQDTIKVSDSVVSISSLPGGNYLLLADNKADTLELLRISFVVDIDISGLPFKGPADAPVVIVVFSDYQ
jgi:protein-disulfide isomerase